MRSKFFVAVAVTGLFSGSVLAQLPITSAPWLKKNASTTQPAELSLLLAPFKSVGDNSNAWIGTAVDEGVASDLARDPALRVTRSAVNGDGLDEARKAGANRLIIGTYQLVDDQLRIDGQVIDVGTGKPVGHLKTVGAKRDLFQLEDNLVAEIEHDLPHPDQPDEGFTVTPVQLTPVQQQSVVVQSAPPDASSSVVYDPGYSDGNYDDGYPDYGLYGNYYGSPYFGSGFLFLGGNGRFHNRGFNNGAVGNLGGYHHGIGHFNGFHGGSLYGGFFNRQIGGGGFAPNHFPGAGTAGSVFPHAGFSGAATFGGHGFGGGMGGHR